MCCICPKGILLDAPHDSLNLYSPRWTPLAQRCTRKAQLCDHIATDNLYRSAEPCNVLDYFPYSNNPSFNADGSSNNSMTSPFTSNSTTGRNFTPVAPTPVPSDHIASPSFSPSCDAGNLFFTSTFISSPSASSNVSDVQPDVTHTQAYNSDNYSDPFISSYARQSDGEATNESYYEYQDYPNEMYGAMLETWSGPYA